jgi:uncharacterized membrane protein
MDKKKGIRITLIALSIIIVGIGFLAPDSDIRTVIMGLFILSALIVIDIFTPQIADLSKDNPKLKTMRRLNHLTMAAIVISFAMIQWIPAAKTLFIENEDMFSVAIAAGIMIVIGNTAPKLPFNRYMGLRLPWTVRDEMTWKIAHKLLGYITFPIVAVMVAGGILGDAQTFIKYSIIAWVAVLGLYSGWYYYLRVSGKR